jgi:hypothetical protein
MTINLKGFVIGENDGIKGDDFKCCLRKSRMD